MKAFFGLDLLLIGAIVSIGMLIAAIMPFFFLRINLVGLVQTEIRQNQVGLAYLALITSTNGGKPILNLLSEEISSGVSQNLDSIIQEKMNKISFCYKLSTKEKVISKSRSDKCIFSQNGETDLKTIDEFTLETKLPLPYSPNKKTETVILAIA